MTHYNRMLETIKEGYHIKETKYKNGVKTYQLQKRTGKGEYSCSYEFNIKLARILVRAGGIIRYAKKITIPLNFNTTSIPDNTVRYVTA